MEQARHRQKRTQKRAPWFVLILFALIVVTAVGVSFVMLRSARTSQTEAMERSLASEAQNRVSGLTIWFGAIKSQVATLTKADLFRLFASEINRLGDKHARFMKLAEKYRTVTDRSDLDENEALAGNSLGDDLPSLAARLPLMRSVLEKFLEQGGFVSGVLANAKGIYLTTQDAEQELVPEQIQAVREVLEMGQLQVLPARLKADGRLILDILQPLFAPSYAAEPDGKAVGVLLLSRDITKIIEEASPHAGAGHSPGSGHVLQVAGGGLQAFMLNPGGGLNLHALPDWLPDSSGDLPFAARGFPAEQGMHKVYSLGIRVPCLPWVVEQNASLEQVDSLWKGYRQKVIFVATASALIAVLLLGMVWWWLVGRRERAVSAELRQLYHTVNEQKQLLAGINGTLADGIVLEDATGKIRYANQAFARMVSKEVQSIISYPTRELLGAESAERIAEHTGQVLATSVPATFTEVFSLPSGMRHYQVAYSPFEEEGGTSGVVSVYRDITRLVEVQEHAQRMVSQTVSVLVRAIEAVDPYLRGQSTQSGRLAVYLAQGFGLASEDEDTLRIAANLSQIGMIQLPRELLNKSDTLTQEERTELRQHVIYAREVLEGIDFGLPVLETICQMHERLDGSGYPCGLREGEITRDARILAVANTFCALVRPRSYRQARDVEESLAILSTLPPQYDQEVVAALRRFLASPEGEVFLKNLQEQRA